MNKLLISIFLSVMTSPIWAQAGGLLDADVNDLTHMNDPRQAAQTEENQWMAFSIPAQTDTASLCCWEGEWNQHREVACSLERNHYSFGSHSDSPLAERFIVFSQLDNGEVISMLVVGETCPVEGNGKSVNWLGAVDEDHGLDWLESVARSDQGNIRGGSALHALALHRSEKANRKLIELAMETDGELAEESIFWLGHSRKEEGFDALSQLLNDLPQGERRREINFALSQNGTDNAARLLIDISRSDPDTEQRSGALFWLAQEFPETATSVLLELLQKEQNEDVLEQAVFAVSQLPAKTSTAMLLKLAKSSDYSRQVRRQALFWLAQSDDEAVEALAALLSH